MDGLIELLSHYGLLPFVHIIAVLLAACFVESYCLHKGGSLEAPWGTITILMMTVLLSLFLSFYLYIPIDVYLVPWVAKVYPELDLSLEFPITYYLAAASPIALGIWLYSLGIRRDWRAGRRRLVLFRLPIMGCTVFLAAMALVAPMRIDIALAAN